MLCYVKTLSKQNSNLFPNRIQQIGFSNFICKCHSQIWNCFKVNLFKAGNLASMKISKLDGVEKYAIIISIENVLEYIEKYLNKKIIFPIVQGNIL